MDSDIQAPKMPAASYLPLPRVRLSQGPPRLPSLSPDPGLGVQGRAGFPTRMADASFWTRQEEGFEAPGEDRGKGRSPFVQSAPYGGPGGPGGSTQAPSTHPEQGTL